MVDRAMGPFHICFKSMRGISPAMIDIPINDGIRIRKMVRCGEVIRCRLNKHGRNPLYLAFYDFIIASEKSKLIFKI